MCCRMKKASNYRWNLAHFVQRERYNYSRKFWKHPTTTKKKHRTVVAVIQIPQDRLRRTATVVLIREFLFIISYFT